MGAVASQCYESAILCRSVGLRFVLRVASALQRVVEPGRDEGPRPRETVASRLVFRRASERSRNCFGIGEILAFDPITTHDASRLRVCRLLRVQDLVGIAFCSAFGTLLAAGLTLSAISRPSRKCFRWVSTSKSLATEDNCEAVERLNVHGALQLHSEEPSLHPTKK